RRPGAVMTCAEFKEVVALYALGSVDAAERAACDAHLGEKQHEGCFEALAEANDTVAALALALPEVKPGPKVWPAIERGVGIAAAAGETGPAGRGRAPRRQAWFTFGLVAACAALAVYWWWDRREERADTAQAMGELRKRVDTAAQTAVAVAREREVCRG